MGKIDPPLKPDLNNNAEGTCKSYHPATRFSSPIWGPSICDKAPVQVAIVTVD